MVSPCGFLCSETSVGTYSCAFMADHTLLKSYYITAIPATFSPLKPKTADINYQHIYINLVQPVPIVDANQETVK